MERSPYNISRRMFDEEQQSQEQNNKIVYQKKKDSKPILIESKNPTSENSALKIPIPNLQLQRIVEQPDPKKVATHREIKSHKLYDEMQKITHGFRIGTIIPSFRENKIETQISPRISQEEISKSGIEESPSALDAESLLVSQ